MPALPDYEPTVAHPACEVASRPRGRTQRKHARARADDVPSCTRQACGAAPGEGLCRGCTFFLCRACCLGAAQAGRLCAECGLACEACVRTTATRCAESEHKAVRALPGHHADACRCRAGAHWLRARAGWLPGRACSAGVALLRLRRRRALRPRRAGARRARGRSARLALPLRLSWPAAAVAGDHLGGALRPRCWRPKRGSPRPRPSAGGADRRCCRGALHLQTSHPQRR